MATKDNKSRRARRGGRANRDSMGEVEAAAGSASSESSVLEASKPKIAALLHTIDEDAGLSGASGPGPGKSPVHALLGRLPTPVRSSTASPPLEKQQQHQEQEWQQQQQPWPRASVEPSPVAQPQAVAKGPEPWELQDSSTTQPLPQAGQGQAAYRDRLRARGQQAMQRAPGPRGPMAATGRPPVPTAAPTQAPSLPPMLPQGMAPSPTSSPGPAQRMAGWSSPNEMQMQQCFAQQCFGPAGMEMSPIMADTAMQGSMSPDAQEAAFSFFGCQQGAMSPMESQQATMSFFPCQQGASTPASVGQQTPMSYFGCNQQGSSTPVGGGQQTPTMSFFGNGQQGQPAPAGTVQQGAPESATPVNCGSSSMSQVDDLISTVMGSDASLLDREQIADYLRAAAPCCYDD